MTQHLNLLKSKLLTPIPVDKIKWNQKIAAIQDGLYSCDLSVVALEQWISIWTQTDSHCLTEDEVEYQEGVKFVSDEWEIIKGVE
jgi:hypothetical protein